MENATVGITLFTLITKTTVQTYNVIITYLPINIQENACMSVMNLVVVVYMRDTTAV